MIYILTDKIRSGKTTALQAWSEKRNDVDGLLCPDNKNGKRYFFKIKSKEKFLFEIDDEASIKNEDIVEIGRFKFLKTAFAIANNYLLSVVLRAESKYLVIDELGKLELKNEGLHLSAEKLIYQLMHHKTKHLILVVRDYLLDDIVKHYTITDFKLITKAELTKNSFA